VTLINLEVDSAAAGSAKPLSGWAKPLSGQPDAGEAALRAKPLSTPLVPFHGNQRGAICKKIQIQRRIWLLSEGYTQGVTGLSPI